MYPTSALKSVRQNQQLMSSWLQIHIHLNPNLIYSGYDINACFWSENVVPLTKTCSTPCDLPQKVICDNQEWISWRQDGGLQPILPVHCVWSGLMWVGGVKGCLRRTVHLGLSALQDCQRKSFILHYLLEVDLGNEILQGSSLRRGTGEGFSPRGVWCCPVVLRGRWSGAVSTALRRTFQAVSRLAVTTKSTIMFGFLEVRKICLPCPPRFLLLVQLRGYKIYFRLTFNSTSAPLSLSSSQNMWLLPAFLWTLMYPPVPKASPQRFQCRHCSRDSQWRIDFCWPLSYLTSFSRFSETMKGTCYTQSNLKQYSCLIFKGIKWKCNINSPAIASEGRDHLMALAGI